jgi:hypothetical protein
MASKLCPLPDFPMACSWGFRLTKGDCWLWSLCKILEGTRNYPFLQAPHLRCRKCQEESTCAETCCEGILDLPWMDPLCSAIVPSTAQTHRRSSVLPVDPHLPHTSKYGMQGVGGLPVRASHATSVVCASIPSHPLVVPVVDMSSEDLPGACRPWTGQSWLIIYCHTPPASLRHSP